MCLSVRNDSHQQVDRIQPVLAHLMLTFAGAKASIPAPRLAILSRSQTGFEPREELSVRSAVFLDRDGVINENRQGYVKSWDEFVFLPRALPALGRLARTPYLILIVSNQSAINRKLVSWADVNEVNRRMVREIRKVGGRIDGIYVCPHRPDEMCECRKPKPGLLYQAADELSIDLRSSYLVGDALADVEAALAAGCTPFLVLTGRGRDELERARQDGPTDFVYASELAKIVYWIERWAGLYAQ